MSKGSGGSRGALVGESNYKGEVKNIETLKNMVHNDAYKAMAHAISRFHSVMGVRQRDVKLATLDAGVMGVHVTENGQSKAVYLSKQYFKNKTAAEIKDSMKKMYEDGWQTKTNQPVSHVITHELAHATWNSHLSTPEAKAATAEIRELHRDWSRDTKKTGYGAYSKANVNEFWAETSTKAVHGTPDKYTRRVKEIIKKYNL